MIKKRKSYGLAWNLNAAVNYIEEHILEELDLNMLGNLAGCSSLHFQRIFSYIAGVCKKLNGLKCTPTCMGGYRFFMDGVEYKKCKNMAFFPTLADENYDAIKKLIKVEIGE